MKMKRIVLLLGIVTAIVAFLTTYETMAQAQSKMIHQDVYPVFVTKDLKVCKEFYGKWFDLQPVFESSFFILLVSAGENSRSIGFLSEVHPSSPPSNPAMDTL